MKNFKIGTFALVLASVLILSACSKRSPDSKEIAEDQNEEKFDDTEIESDAEFAVSVADGGMLEVELGRLAQSNGSSEAVRMLADMMVTDHSKANDELKALAAQKNISLPTALSEKSQKAYNDLVAKTGKDFDDAYTDLMVKDHKKDIDKFKKEAEKGDDADIKSWASGKISTLEHHLMKSEEAEAVADSLKKQ